jgi:hypothetical protein
MMQGRKVEGIPGESNSHKLSHLMAIIAVKSEVEADPNIDPMLAQQAMDFIQRLSEHLGLDDQDRSGNQGFKGGPQGQMIPQGGPQAIPTAVQQPQQPGVPNVGDQGQQVMPPMMAPLPPM